MRTRNLLAFIVIPLALVPIALSVYPPVRESVFIVGPSICIAAPALGFWLGEIVGKSNEGRAGLGCLSTFILFIAYLGWAFFLAPRLIP